MDEKINIGANNSAPATEYGNYSNSTYKISLSVAYLIGVQKYIFESAPVRGAMEIYNALDTDKSARIIRNLSMLRTCLMRNYNRIFTCMRYDMKNLYSLPEYIPQDALQKLSDDGISIFRANATPAQYITDINNHICNRVNNIKHHFPIWLNWEYVRQLFVMPHGLSAAGIEKARQAYGSNIHIYPYQIYVNFPIASKDWGNILHNDKKFVSALYNANGDYFKDLSKVSDATEATKERVYDFLDESERVVVVVDCENSDPYRLYGALNNLNQEALLSKVKKIILYDDVHTSSAWKILEQFTDIPIEHVLIERIKENKSLVDIRLAMGTSKEFYQNQVDSFILVSSDSDYWGMISALTEARFFVMVETEKCSPAIKTALVDAGISYCYINDFCTGNSNDIKIAAILAEMRKTLDGILNINMLDIFNDACKTTRAEMRIAEKDQFFNKYIKNIKLDIAASGNVSIEFGK